MLAQDLLAKRKWKDTGQAKTTEGDVASPPSRRAAAEPIAELDQIFSKAKRPAVSVEQKKEPAKQKRTLVKGNKADIFGSGIRKERRRDEEGLPVYSPEELGVGRGGDTPDCPFDCDCCF